MPSRLQTLSRGSRAMLADLASNVRYASADFFRNPSAKHYRQLEAALLEYQETFQKYEQISSEELAAREDA